MFLFDSTFFAQSTAANALLLPIGESGRAFFALSSDAQTIETIRSNAKKIADRFSIAALLEECGVALMTTSAQFVYLDSPSDRLESFSLNAPPILAKGISGGVIDLGFSQTTIGAQPNVNKAAQLGTIFLTLDANLAAEIRNHLPFAFSGKEIIDALEKFTESKNYEFVFINRECADTIEERTDTIDAKIEAIKRYELRFERLLERYMPNDDEAATNTQLIFSELITNAYEHGTLGIDKTQKQQMINNGTYEKYVLDKEKTINAKLRVSLKVLCGGFLRVDIVNNGNGFDYEDYLYRRESAETSAFHGRGISMSFQISTALFYADYGRRAIYFMRFRAKSAAEKVAADEVLLKTISVLYAEDDLFVRDYVDNMLKRAVKNLLLAQNGAEALALFERYRPDIVITDVEMPLMDGLDLVKSIRAISRDVPIIITTAHNDESFYTKAIEAGVDKFLTKPLRISTLYNALYRFVRSIYLNRQANSFERTRIRLLGRDDSEHIAGIKIKNASASNAVCAALSLDSNRYLLYLIRTDESLVLTASALVNVIFTSAATPIEAIERFADEIGRYLLDTEHIHAGFAVCDTAARAIFSVAFGDVNLSAGGDNRNNPIGKSPCRNFAYSQTAPQSSNWVTLDSDGAAIEFAP
ncbi:MAG: response regulator [Helicobacteraceae bacterium]|jgi:CheY-like chemotaxis protein|nr:response regulator [Helicobacteraceae bacterium]